MSISPIELVEHLRNEFFAERSLTHADLRVKEHNGAITVAGTVLDRPAAQLLLGALYQRLPKVNWRDEMTPLVAGPDYSWAVAKRPVVDVCGEPSHAAERVTQLIFGEPLEVLRLVGGWAFIRAHDGYLGWVPHEPLVTFTAEAVRDWMTSATHLVRQPMLACYADRTGDPHQQMMLLPFGARLNVEGADGPYRSIRCPEGVVRWVPATGLLPIKDTWHTGAEGLRTVVNWAHALFGVPYLWGGRTPFGYDCSGLVQMFYAMIGVDLRRNADQQAAEGHPVERGEIAFGDCLFFDTDAPEADLHASHELRITHVALALDAENFIHASRRFGGVVRGSFDPHSPWHAPTYRERLVAVRRYI